MSELPFLTMRRGIAELTPSIVLTLYFVMVHPHFDYAVEASAFYLQKDINRFDWMHQLRPSG